MAGEFAVVVIGEPERVRGYSLAGAVVHECADAGTARAAWAAIGDDVAVVLLTRAAAAAIERPSAGSRPLTVVLPV